MATAAAAGRTAGAASRPGRVATAGVVAAGVLVGAICLAVMAANPSAAGDSSVTGWNVRLVANLFWIGACHMTSPAT